MKKYCALLLSIMLVTVFTACAGSDEQEEMPPQDAVVEEEIVDEEVTEQSELEVPEKEEETVPLELDDLQSLFVTLTYSTTMEDLENYANEKHLEYSKKKTGEGYRLKFAFESGVTSQDVRYADDGSYVDMIFSSGAVEDIKRAEYYDYDYHGSALFYNYGVPLSGGMPENEYSGWYYVGNDGEGVDNTKYVLCENGEDAIKQIIKKAGK